MTRLVGHISVACANLLSLIQPIYGVVVVDYIYLDRHIGVFSTKRRTRTSFLRS